MRQMRFERGHRAPARGRRKRVVESLLHPGCSERANVEWLTSSISRRSGQTELAAFSISARPAEGQDLRRKTDASCSIPPHEISR